MEQTEKILSLIEFILWKLCKGKFKNGDISYVLANGEEEIKNRKASNRTKVLGKSYKERFV